MEKVLVFVGLKVAEVLGIVFIPYYLGRLGHIINCDDFRRDLKRSKILRWVVGSVIAAIIYVCIFGVIQLVVLNWEWAGMLIK